MPVTLSIALMTHNEIAEFGWLMQSLAPLQNAETEIVVLDDFSHPDMVNLIKSQNVRFYQRALNKNFSAQRNYLKDLCEGEFIFLLDPDEIPSSGLIEAMPNILHFMRENKSDGCCMPRLNILHDGDRPVDARTLAASNADLLNQKRDDMMRILKNDPRIKWVNRVHERLIGIERACRLPQDVRFALLHCKSRSRYEKQNSFYRSIRLRYLDKWRKSLAKRLGLIKQPEWTEVPLGSLGER